MKYSEVERKLKKYGCRCLEEDGSHPLWFSPITNEKFTLSHHRSEEVRPGTLKQIIKSSGVKL
jgi:predicted RNA binding protein YcfA (HicA-like mRNA interferase family)